MCALRLRRGTSGATLDYAAGLRIVPGRRRQLPPSPPHRQLCLVHTPGFLTDLILLFGLSVLVVLVFHQLRLPSIVGFLFTGVLAGPYGFALIRNVRDVEALAEVGVILLLFTVGLEFSLAQLARIKRLLLVGGGLQVSVTLLVAMLVERALGETWPVSVFVGMLVALSSTAIVLRLLAERAELDTPHGKLALGILIFQDLCVVPMVLIRSEERRVGK